MFGENFINHNPDSDQDKLDIRYTNTLNTYKLLFPDNEINPDIWNEEKTTEYPIRYPIPTDWAKSPYTTEIYCQKMCDQLPLYDVRKKSIEKYVKTKETSAPIPFKKHGRC